MAAAACVMSNPTRWTLALRSGRLGRILGRKRGAIGEMPLPLVKQWTDARDLPARRSRPSATGGPRTTERQNERPSTSSGSGGPARGRRAGSGGKQAMLQRIAQAHAAAPPDARPMRRSPATTGPPPTSMIDALVERLVDRLVDYKALVRRCPARDLPATVAAALTERGADAAGRARRPGPGLADRTPTPICGSTALTPTTSSAWPSSTHVDGVITACAVAVAETGTLILDGSAGMGRRVITPDPDYHLCVVLPEQIWPTCRRRWPARPDPAADHDQRPQRHQRHRAQPGRRAFTARGPSR